MWMQSGPRERERDEGNIWEKDVVLVMCPAQGNN